MRLRIKVGMFTLFFAALATWLFERPLLREVKREASSPGLTAPAAAV